MDIETLIILLSLYCSSNASFIIKNNNFFDLSDSNKSLVYLRENDDEDEELLTIDPTDLANTTDSYFEYPDILESNCKTCIIPTLIIALIGLTFIILGLYYICKERRRRKQTLNIINSNDNTNQINVVYN